MRAFHFQYERSTAQAHIVEIAERYEPGGAELKLLFKEKRESRNLRFVYEMKNS